MANEKTAGFSSANHVGITVSSLEKSVAFYEGLTGVKIANNDEIGGPRMAKTQGQDDTFSKATFNWII